MIDLHVKTGIRQSNLFDMLAHADISSVCSSGLY